MQNADKREAYRNAFYGDDYAISNAVPTTLKRKKSRGSMYRGVDGMYSKKARESIGEQSHLDGYSVTQSNNTGLNRKSQGGMAIMQKHKCPM